MLELGYRIPELNHIVVVQLNASSDLLLIDEGSVATASIFDEEIALLAINRRMLSRDAGLYDLDRTVRVPTD